VALRHGGRELLRYVFRPDTPLAESPRPYAHPVRTLAGRIVTGYRPADHSWHAGISLAVAHVSGVDFSGSNFSGSNFFGVNFWGGPTYVRGRGYVPLDDHGVIRHDGWVSAPNDSVIDEELSWLSPAGVRLVRERRTLVIDSVDEARGQWLLRFSFRLVNASGGPLELGSPATHGRAGAGYGGLFWRGARSFVGGSAHTPGGSAVNGARTPWLAFTDADAGSTVVYYADPVAAEPWFVRTTEYPGVCAALAFDHPLTLAPDAGLVRDYRIVIV
jgi:Methane oxygenase PmoA/Pentapeptide repeats (8 copies)